MTTSADFHAKKLEADRANHRGDYEACIKLLSPFLETDADDHWLHFHLGRAYSGRGAHDDAIKHFSAAAASSYPFRVGAMYEIVRLDMSVGRFDRVDMLDQALALPGDVALRDEGGGQKRYYFDKIQFLRGLARLEVGDLAEADRRLGLAYDFNRTIDERGFAYGWLVELLTRTEFPEALSNLAYLKQRLLRVGMARGLSYISALGRLPRGAKVLEIGAMDGVRFDPLHKYLKTGMFDGIVVEPIAEMFRLLSETYAGHFNVTCANVAISEASGPLRLFGVSSADIDKHGLPEWMHGITSAVKGPVLSYLGDLVREEVVRGLSFEDFVKEYAIDNIDVLQIDTEGFDWNILKQIDLGKHGVKIAQIEIINLTPGDRTKVFEFLAESGYVFDYEFGDVVAASPAFHATLRS